ncbi:MAG: hypothetical protein A2W01_06370 [Candidatus Solincola sediminis]|uniref:Serine aminopeptidase S33 domain-containing protein n=1 Tax=Candidatus Solincola sediminis TaxID=1797199 RepID=A0A1F2WNQ2_9ACTN|nr:MAG: hypothetical protein A2Y75_02690 [Candidatus Solincola sediminis]OFW59532.1 MAG: hypothetical protein A2W01_06370 [Candidatus Solincola sediminis]
MGKKSFLAVTITFLLIFILALGGMPALAKAKLESDLYTAETVDGVTLAMKRYRPDESARFRKGAQPIVLMPGILCGLNYYDVRTPPGENYEVKLPSPLASWAKGDKYIKKDHMRYYSLAHYLWLQGYDVWMANYRGEGREPYQSGGATGYSLDDLGIYDVPAIVEKVYTETGKHPVWLGHSMGSTMAYIYLEGAKYGDGGNPHVVSDPALAEERNGGNGPQSIKALVDIDGPVVPFTGHLVDNFPVWAILYWPWYLNLRPLTAQYGEYLADPFFSIIDMMWQISEASGCPDLDIINAFLCVNKENFDPAVAKFTVEYVLDGFSSRVFGQYFDASAHGVLREDFCNGDNDLFPPEPCNGDGYYYYSDNLGKIKLPTLVMADGRHDVTNPDDVRRFFESKARTNQDAFVMVPDAAHLDLIGGLNSPTFTFSEVGKWLKKLK